MMPGVADESLNDEVARLKAEVAELRARQEGADGEDPWRGLKDYSKAIEEGRMNDFLMERSASPLERRLIATFVLGGISLGTIYIFGGMAGWWN